MVRLLPECMQQLYRMVRNGPDVTQAWGGVNKAGENVGTLKNAKRGYPAWNAAEAAKGTPAPAPNATSSNTDRPPKPGAESAVMTGDAIGQVARRTTHQMGVD